MKSHLRITLPTFFVLLSANLTAITASAVDFTSSAGPQIGRYLQPEAVPASVRKAANEIHRLGREEADFFGLQRLEVYSIPKTSAELRLKKIVADVIEASRQHGDYSLASFCLTGTDDLGRTLQFDDDNECAAYLIGHERHARFESILEIAGGSYDNTSVEGKAMRLAVSKLDKFAKSVVGSDPEEVSVSMTGLNVDETTIVLINKKLRRVLIMKLDYGA